MFFYTRSFQQHGMLSYLPVNPPPSPPPNPNIILHLSESAQALYTRRWGVVEATGAVIKPGGVIHSYLSITTKVSHHTVQAALGCCLVSNITNHWNHPLNNPLMHMKHVAVHYNADHASSAQQVPYVFCYWTMFVRILMLQIRYSHMNTALYFVCIWEIN